METSKVLVTYSDPSEIYGSIAGNLNSQFPLRKLNWNPPSRPLRSIPSLHVELVQDHVFAATNDSAGKKNATPGDDYQEIASSRGRRHQIPGLRQSPYLKIYFLRCDDVDTYRNTERKVVREWIQANTSQPQNSATANKQDNHDAFEWLIVHVVSDPAATVPGGSKADGDKTKRSGTSRWSSRGTSSSVIDKVRTDVNASSKNAVDRVVQISSGANEDSETSGPGDPASKIGWEDLVKKTKSLILASFDRRVSQYEEDIREKEVQRKLPGWNFNTFFVLKEGLARGFESVGLLDDALTGYQELAAELNVLVDDRDLVNASSSPFNPYTDELQQDITHMISSNVNPDARESEIQDFGSMVLDTKRKNYRNLILSNNISVFDFQSYVFARQFRILLRLANVGHQTPNLANAHKENESSRSDNLSKPTDNEPENLVVLAEACQLASSFLASTANQLRADLSAAYEDLPKQDNEIDKHSKKAIDNLVSSWIMSSTQTILSATTSQTLSAQLRPVSTKLYVDQKLKTDLPRVESRGSQGFPSRRSSLPPTSPIKTRSDTATSSSITALDALRILAPGTPHHGARELAAERGNLVLLSRRALSSCILDLRGWYGGLASAITEAHTKQGHVEEVDLSLENSSEALKSKDSAVPTPVPLVHSARNRSLASALRSEENFLTVFGDLTTSALSHFVVANRNNVAESLIADVAVTRFSLKDYGVAASYFDQLANFYRRTEWQSIEKVMLRMHSECLKSLGKIGDFIRAALQVISMEQSDLWDSQDDIWTIADLIEISSTLKEAVKVPLRGHFTEFFLDPYIHHQDDRDGFQMRLKFRSLLPGNFTADAVNVKAVPRIDRAGHEINLETTNQQKLTKGNCRVSLSTNTINPVWYTPKTVSIQAKKVIFEDDWQSLTIQQPNDVHRLSNSHKTSSQDQEGFLVWAQRRNLSTRLSHFDAIDLRKPRSLQFDIFSGGNTILEGQISLRAASAGLRLDTVEAKLVQNEVGTSNSSNSGSIVTKDQYLKIVVGPDQRRAMKLEKIPADSSQTIKIPYSLEHDLSKVTVKVEVSYKTEIGTFVYAADSSCGITLPLSVNVQDIFKKDALFSRFTLGPVATIPLRLHSCHIKGNSHYDVVSPNRMSMSTDVYYRQPYSLISRVRRKKFSNERASISSKVSPRLLHLQIEYHCLDQEIRAVLQASLEDLLKAHSTENYCKVLEDVLLRGQEFGKSFEADMETSCLVGELAKGKYEDYRWVAVLPGFEPDVSEKLEQLLKQWHQKPQLLPLGPPWPASLRKQHLTVPFEIPQTDVLFTVELSARSSRTVDTATQTSMAIDQPLAMQLIVTSTTKWGPEKGSKVANDMTEFYYELLASPDVWVVGGERRAKFHVTDGQSQSFEVLLLPRMTGHLLYPSVEIAPISRVGQEGSPERGDEGQVSYEVDFVNQGETVLVVPNLSSTTVSLDPSSGGWLVESRSRSTEPNH